MNRSDEDSNKIHEFVAHSTAVNTLTFGPLSNQVLATGGEDCKVNIWRVSNVTNVWSLGQNKSPVESLCFDNDEQYIVSGALNGSLKIFDLHEGKLARTLLGHQVNTCTLHYHPFGEFIVSGSIDTTMKVWDIRNKSCIQTYTGHEKEITCVRFSPDGRWVASSGKDGQLFIWDLIAGKIINSIRIQPSQTYISTFEFNPTEFVLAGVTSGRSVRLWDLDTMEQIGYTPPETSPIRAMAFSSQGKTISTATGDGLKVWEWDPITLKAAASMGWDRVSEIRVSADNQLIGGSSYSNFVSVWSSDIDALLSATALQSKDEDKRSRLKGVSRPVRASTPLAAEPKLEANDRNSGLMIQGQKHGVNAGGAKAISGPEVQWSDGVNPSVVVSSMAESFRQKQQLQAVPAPAKASNGAGVAGLAGRRNDRDSKDNDKEEKGAGGFGLNPNLANMLPARDPVRYQIQSSGSSGAASSQNNNQGPSYAVGGPGGGALVREKKDGARKAVPSTSAPVSNPFPGGPISDVSPNRFSPAVKDSPKSQDGPRKPSAHDFGSGRATSSEGNSDADVAARRRGATEEGRGRDRDREKSEETLLVDEAERLSNISIAVTATLQQRITTLRMIHRLWEKGDMENVLSQLHLLHDGAILDSHQVVSIVHFLEKADLRSSSVNLDGCIELLPLLCSLLLQDINYRNENYAIAALRAVAMLSISFGTLIRQTRSVLPAGKVDLSREERLKKCNLCHKMFSQIYSGLESIRKKHRGTSAIINLTDNVAQLLEEFL